MYGIFKIFIFILFVEKSKFQGVEIERRSQIHKELTFKIKIYRKRSRLNYHLIDFKFLIGTISL
jgi:hypothetical protein